MEFETYLAMAITIAAVLEINFLALLVLIRALGRDRETLAQLEGPASAIPSSE